MYLLKLTSFWFVRSPSRVGRIILCFFFMSFCFLSVNALKFNLKHWDQIRWGEPDEESHDCYFTGFSYAFPRFSSNSVKRTTNFVPSSKKCINLVYILTDQQANLTDILFSSSFWCIYYYTFCIHFSNKSRKSTESCWNWHTKYTSCIHFNWPPKRYNMSLLQCPPLYTFCIHIILMYTFCIFSCSP